jgi:predicted phage terminase large subunit-like protein
MTGFSDAIEEFRARAEGRSHRRWTSPGQLAQTLDPKTVQTPALALIDDCLVELANTPDGRLIISMSPQEGKSQRISRRLPLWALTRDPEMRVAIASYELSVARRWGRAIRDDILVHPELGLILRGDVAAQHEWQLDGHEGGLYCVGVGGPLTGRPVDMMIIDDPVKDREQADSLVYRKRVWDWWVDVASPRLAPGAPVVLVLTRWHEDDLAGRLVNAADGHIWRVLNIPAQAEAEDDPLGRRPGEFLESARGRTEQQWEAIKVRAGSRTWASLYQGRPAPAEGAIFKREWIKTYDQPQWSTGDDGTRRALNMSTVLASWDMTFKDSAAADFVVGQVWGRRGADVFLLDQMRGRWSFTETLQRVQQLAARWPGASTKLIEDKANGTAVIDSLRKKITGLVPINPTESKIARAEAVSPFVEAGNVHVPSPSLCPWAGDFIEELTSFPSAAHDDQVDAATQALQRLMLRGGGLMGSLRMLCPDCPQCGHPYKASEGWCRSCEYVDESHTVDLSGVAIRPAPRPEPDEEVEQTPWEQALAAMNGANLPGEASPKR